MISQVYSPKQLPVYTYRNAWAASTDFHELSYQRSFLKCTHRTKLWSMLDKPHHTWYDIQRGNSFLYTAFNEILQNHVSNIAGVLGIIPEMCLMLLLNRNYLFWHCSVRFEVLTAVFPGILVFWDETLCFWVSGSRHFETPLKIKHYGPSKLWKPLNKRHHYTTKVVNPDIPFPS
jgi:hypothetical protein